MKRGMIFLSLLLVTSITFVSASSFVSTWNTALTSTGSSNSTQITLPLVSSGTYNFVVDWGDGSSSTITSYNQAQITHNYASAGTYTVSITGTIVGWEFNNAGDRLKITDISSWGPLNLGNTGYYFSGTSNLNISATDILNLSGTTTMIYAFSNSGISTVPGMNSWGMGKVTDMVGMFQEATSFNQNIGNWDTSQVTNMNGMFYGDASFNQPIGNWNTNSVTLMRSIFYDATSFNQPLNNWNTSSVISMNYMFQGATSFNQNINSWNTGKVTEMPRMFYGATSFNQPLNNWNTSKVTNMYQTFYQDPSFDQNLSSWNVSKVTNMANMFFGDNLSTANYDSLLNGWALLPSLQSNVTFDAGNSMYSSSAVSVRNALTSTYGWTITDGGEVGGSGGGTSKNSTTNTSVTGLTGDLNGDNKIDSLDLMVVLKYILGISRVSAADINGDGKINIFDLVLEGKLYGETISTSTALPKVVAAKPSGTLASGTTSVVLFAKTNEWATCKYSTSSSATYSSMSSFTRSGRVSHSIDLTGLSNGNHVYYIQCKSANGYLNSTNYVVNFTIGSSGSNTGSSGNSGNQNTNSSSNLSLPAPNLFKDTFESGSLDASKATLNVNGLFSWSGSANTPFTIVNDSGCITYTTKGVKGACGFQSNQWENAPDGSSGHYAARAHYDANSSQFAEQDFNLGTNYTDIWFRFWLRVPINFIHQNLYKLYGIGPPSSNNKLFAVWMDKYDFHGNGSTVVWEYNQGEYSLTDGGSTVSWEFTPGNYTGSGGHRDYQPFITYPQDRGRWMQIVIHLKASTTPSAHNGIIQLWRRWSNESSFTKIHENTTVNLPTPSGGPDGWHYGYVLGASNSWWANSTEFLIDDFEVSTEPLVPSSSL